MSESDAEYDLIQCIDRVYFRRETTQVVVEEEKSDNIHDATKVVIKKSLAHDGRCPIIDSLESILKSSLIRSCEGSK